MVYNLVRLEMARVADQLEISPLRISYRTSLLLIRYEIRNGLTSS